MIRQMMLVTAVAVGLAGCNLPQTTKMEPIEAQVQPANAAAPAKPGKSQLPSAQPSG